MHAYLIISKNNESIFNEVNNIIKNQSFKLLEFQLQKIDDARNLNAFLKLSIPGKTAVLVKNFQNATEECINAMLKNLEEPQKDLIFFIHATNENLIPPTIISRCQIIKSRKIEEHSDLTEIEEFFKLDTFKKSIFLNKRKTKEEAILFSDNLIQYYTRAILKGINVSDYEEGTKQAIILRKSLFANGNVNLHTLRFLTHITD